MKHEAARLMPQHPYTAGLLASRPSTETVRRLLTIPGRAIAAYEAGERSITAALRRLAIGELADLDPVSLRDADEPGDLPR